MPVNWGMDHFLYTKGLSALETFLTLVYWDPRGVGRSSPVDDEAQFALGVTARDGDALRAHLGFEKTVVFGHSDGGAVALTYALLHPERVDKLILVSTAATGEYVGGEDGPYPATTEAMRKALRRSMDRAVVHPERFRATLDRIVPRVRLSPARYRYAGEVERPRYDVTDRLKDIAVPVLVVAGREDAVVPWRASEALAARIPRARLVVLDGCGHWPFVEQRRAFLEGVRSFLSL
jgi:proline iminopeptidase